MENGWHALETFHHQYIREVIVGSLKYFLFCVIVSLIGIIVELVLSGIGSARNLSLTSESGSYASDYTGGTVTVIYWIAAGMAAFAYLLVLVVKLIERHNWIKSLEYRFMRIDPANERIEAPKRLGISR